METGKVIYEKVYMSPRPPPKISLKHEWKRELGSEHVQRSEVGQLSRSFQTIRPILNPIRKSTGRPVIKDDASTVQDGRKTSRFQEIDVNSFHEESVFSERTGRNVIETSLIQARSSEDRKDPTLKRHMKERGDSLLKQTQKKCQIVLKHVLFMYAKRSTLEIKHFVKKRGGPFIDHDNLSHEQIMKNEADMNFQISSLLHSVVKHALSTSVLELIQKIENHPDRNAFQQDLRQNQACNPFGPESKKMMQDVGNIELFELLETKSKTQCTACLSYWSVIIVDASEIYSKSLNAKEVIFHKENGKIPSWRWTNQTFWRRSGTENIHLDKAATNSRRK